MHIVVRRGQVSLAQWFSLVSLGCFGVTWRTRHTLFGVSIPAWVAGAIISRAFRPGSVVARWLLWRLGGRAGLVLFWLPRRAWSARALARW